MSESFGAMFKRLRIESQQTLRAFCERNGLDAGNISKLERGKMPAPESAEILETYARALGLRPNTEDWAEFHDKAAAERGRVPADLLEDDELVEQLPVLFRALRGTNAHREKLLELAEKIRRA